MLGFFPLSLKPKVIAYSFSSRQKLSKVLSNFSIWKLIQMDYNADRRFSFHIWEKIRLASDENHTWFQTSKLAWATVCYGKCSQRRNGNTEMVGFPWEKQTNKQNPEQTNKTNPRFNLEKKKSQYTPPQGCVSCWMGSVRRYSGNQEGNGCLFHLPIKCDFPAKQSGPVKNALT